MLYPEAVPEPHSGGGNGGVWADTHPRLLGHTETLEQNPPQVPPGFGKGRTETKA